MTGSKKSVPHYGSGEIINDRCTNPTPRALLRYLKTESRRMIALRFCTLASPRGGLDSIRHARQLEYVHCRRMIGCNSLIPRSKLTRWSAYGLNPCSLFRWEWRQFFSRCWPCACCSWVCRPAAGHPSPLRRFERPSIQRMTGTGGEPPWAAVTGDDWLLIPYIRTKTTTTNMILRAATVAPKPHLPL